MGAGIEEVSGFRVDEVGGAEKGESVDIGVGGGRFRGVRRAGWWKENEVVDAGANFGWEEEEGEGWGGWCGVGRGLGNNRLCQLVKLLMSCFRAFSLLPLLIGDRKGVD